MLDGFGRTIRVESENGRDRIGGQYREWIRAPARLGQAAVSDVRANAPGGGAGVDNPAEHVGAADGGELPVGAAAASVRVSIQLQPGGPGAAAEDELAVSGRERRVNGPADVPVGQRGPNDEPDVSGAERGDGTANNYGFDSMGRVNSMSQVAGTAERARYMGGGRNRQPGVFWVQRNAAVQCDVPDDAQTLAGVMDM